MSRRGFPTLLVSLVTVLSGTVMLIGPGLHGLPGCGHVANVSRPVRPVDDGLRVESGGDDQVSSCPVCEYLAQGQIVAEGAHVAATTRSSPSLPALPSLPPDLRPRRTFGCRAPPDGHSL